MWAAIGSAVAIGAGALALVFFNEASTPPPRSAAGTAVDRATRASSPAAGFRRARLDCSTRSEANFPGAFTSPRNLVVDPLVLIGGAYTDASTVRQFGGNKFPLTAGPGNDNFKVGPTNDVRVRELATVVTTFNV